MRTSPETFGAAGDESADDTDQLQDWLDHLRATRDIGILTGRYRVRRGVLRWPIEEPGHTFGPVIYTGSGAALVALPVGSGPLLMVHNHSAYSHIIGGHIGPLRLEQPFEDDRTDCHGISLCGVEGMTFEGLYGTRLSGDLIHIPDVSVNGNTDGYHVYGNAFGTVRADRCRGWALNNTMIGGGFGGNEFHVLRSILCGLWRGHGASNVAHQISVGWCRGWAIDWFGWPGHTGSRNEIMRGEVDAPEYGIRIEGNKRAAIRNVRIKHRSTLAGVQIGNWPIIAVSIGNDAAPRVTSDIFLGIEHQIEPDVTALGTFYDFGSDSQVRRVEVLATLQGSAAAPYYERLHPSATVRMRMGDALLLDRWRP